LADESTEARGSADAVQGEAKAESREEENTGRRRKREEEKRRRNLVWGNESARRMKGTGRRTTGIKGREKTSKKKKKAVLQLRQYQQEVLQVALERNTIVYLETGMGKTLIAVMLMQARRQMRERSGKICIFLVPAVALVIQQAAVVEQQTDMRVGRYSTDTDIKYEATWVQRQASQHEVLVMTPQVLVNLLQHAFLSLSSVDLLIFDECHHTTKDHPYATIMK
ncbi:hypothetical protein CLOP_g19582, partial [Closterium sp. NIES-67]